MEDYSLQHKKAWEFDAFAGVRVANICGSCGKKAIPLALLGADVTVFDISEDNKRYAMETADAAGVSTMRRFVSRYQSANTESTR